MNVSYLVLHLGRENFQFAQMFRRKVRLYFDSIEAIPRGPKDSPFFGNDRAACRHRRYALESVPVSLAPKWGLDMEEAVHAEIRDALPTLLDNTLTIAYSEPVTKP